MRFSRRTAWDRSPNEIARLLEGAPGHGVLDLTETNPTRAGLEAEPAELAAALADAGNVRYEPDPLGLRTAREHLASWLGGGATPERLILTASTSEAYSHLFHLCCDPGDAVLVPTPSYPLFEHLARLEDVECPAYRLRLTDEGWRLDVDALAAALPERARMILLVSPNNPTGSVVSETEVRALAELCAERELTLVSDEVFAEFPLRPHGRPGVPAACERAGALGVVLSGLSKLCGLPQVKLGWMRLGGPEVLVDEARARLELVADTYLSVSTPVQRGLPRLLGIGESFRARVMPRLRANLAALRSSGLRVLPVDGGWTAVVALPEDVPEEAIVAALLREERVLVHPGWLFDLPLPSIVVSLLPEEPVFARGVEAIARRLVTSG